jgi:hypothetical protein
MGLRLQSVLQSEPSTGEPVPNLGNQYWQSNEHDGADGTVRAGLKR